MKHLVIYMDEELNQGAAILDWPDARGEPSSDNPELWGLHKDLEIMATISCTDKRMGPINFDMESHTLYMNGLVVSGSDLLAFQSFEPAPAKIEPDHITSDPVGDGIDVDGSDAGAVADTFNESDPTRPVSGDDGELLGKKHEPIDPTEESDDAV